MKLKREKQHVPTVLHFRQYFNVLTFLTTCYLDPREAYTVGNLTRFSLHMEKKGSLFYLTKITQTPYNNKREEKK